MIYVQQITTVQMGLMQFCAVHWAPHTNLCMGNQHAYSASQEVTWLEPAWKIHIQIH